MERRSPQLTSVGRFALFLSAATIVFLPSTASLHPYGIHPLDEKLYDSEVIKCKDGSKSFSRDRVNDNFCDCPDGTDEPGTSACPRGKFYCRNVGNTPKFLFSSRVNDHLCDCCDGSDEYDGSAICPNTCVMGGNVAYKTLNHRSRADLGGLIKGRPTEKGVTLEDSFQKLTGLKILVIIQAVIVSFAVVYWLVRRRIRPRRRHSRPIGSPTTLSLPF